MADSLHELLHDTLTYLKDPLLPKQTIFANEMDRVFFQKTPPAPKTNKEPSVSENSACQRPLFKPALKDSFPAVSSEPKAKPPIAALPSAPSPSHIEKHPISREKKDSSNDSEIKKALLRVAPLIKLVEEILDDSSARRIASSWKEKIIDTDVVLLACETDADTLELLKSLGKAIDKNLAKAKILPAEKLEVEKRWDLFLQKNQFRLILASNGVQNFPELMKFYKEIPAKSEAYLDKTPLLVLSYASYYKSLEHKALLWKTLCQMLKK